MISRKSLLVILCATFLIGGCATKSQLQKDIEVTQTPRGALLTLSERLLFDSGKYTIKPQADEILSKIAELINTKTKKDIAVEGHTDSVGTKQYNEKLSLNRAQAVRDALVAKGVNPKRIQIAGYGETRPRADNSTEEGRRLNRRTEIFLLGEDKSVVDDNIFAGALAKLKSLFE